LLNVDDFNDGNRKEVWHAAEVVDFVAWSREVVELEEHSSDMSLGEGLGETQVREGGEGQSSSSSTSAA
jgi:hypothetical protein